LPPGQLGGSHAGVGGFVHHIVHLAAKGIKGGDGRAQEQKGILGGGKNRKA
jgi:hypothetical protein